MLEIRKVNEVYAQVICADSVAAELSEHFTIDIPGARFSKAFQSRVWDGKIRLFNRVSNRIYLGLVPRIVEFAQDVGYTVSYAIPNDFADTEFSIQEAKEFIATLNIPQKFEIRWYQLEAFVDAVRHRRAIEVSPTGSGKSMIMYLLIMYYMNVKRFKTNLIIVPNKGLVRQLASDFSDYGYKGDLQQIYFGQDKEHKPIIVTTWQTAYKLPKSWYSPFNLVIGDEGHMFAAKSLMSIMDDKLHHCMYRVALTGSLSGGQVNRLTLEGLFGAVKVVASTKQLQQEGYLAELEIKGIMLSYPQAERDAVKKMDYPQERDYLLAHQKRNKFIRNLALSLEGNTIVLFRHKEHGELLYKLTLEKAGNRPVYFIDGDVDVDVRERIRNKLENEQNAIAVVSYGTFGVGINVINLSNVLFGSPSKQRIRVLQAIGRGLRRGGEKTVATLYDIVDDLSWKGKKGAVHNNYMLDHFKERLTIYASEQFKYKLYTVGLEE